MTEIISACRCPSKFSPPRTSRLNPASASGVRYERRVGKALTTLAIENNLLLETQPWFSYTIQSQSELHSRKILEEKSCAPDFILSPFDRRWIIVIDAKQTFYQAAMDKLFDLYIPVVSNAYGTKARGILICKALIPGAPKPIDSLQKRSLFSEIDVYHWPELGPSIIW